MRRLTVAWRALAYVGLAASLAIAAYGQRLIDDSGAIGGTWPVLGRFDFKLTLLYRVEQSVALAIPLFFLAMALFALSLAYLLRERRPLIEPTPVGPPRTVWPPRAGYGRATLILVAAALAAGWAYLLRRLVELRHEPMFTALFFGLLALTFALALLLDRRRGAQALAGRPRWWEAGLIVALVGVFVGLMLQDLTDYRFAWIGDEGEFFRIGREIARGSDAYNLFSHSGGYGYIPVLSTAYQGAVMKVAGEDIFGWKLASVIIVAATIPVFYWLLKEIAGARAAVFGAMFLTFSHYLFGYAHTGYPNIQALLPTVLSFALFFAGQRRSSMALMLAAGAVAGLGFYTFYSGRLVIFVLALAVLAMGSKRWRWELLIPLAAGFALSVGPMFAVDRWDVVDATLSQSASEQRSRGELISWLLQSMPRVVLAFNYNPYPKHFTSGSLQDGVSAVLALLGLAYAVSRVRDEGPRFLLLWYLVAIVATGLFHPRPNEINSRLHYVLPPMAAFAGLALDRIAAALSQLAPGRRLDFAAGALCAAAVLPAMVILNLDRFYEDTPKVIQASAEGVIYREVSSPSCDIPGYRSVVFASSPVPSVPFVFEFYGWELSRQPLMYRFDAPTSDSETAIESDRTSCVLLTPPDDPAALPTIERMQALAEAAGREVEEATDRSGFTTVLVLRLAGDVSRN